MVVSIGSELPLFIYIKYRALPLIYKIDNCPPTYFLNRIPTAAISHAIFLELRDYGR